MSAKRRLKRTLLLSSAALLLSSCMTFEVLANAPEEFWLTVEKVPSAIFEDISSFLQFIVDLVL